MCWLLDRRDRIKENATLNKFMNIRLSNFVAECIAVMPQYGMYKILP
jgi:hypothetical protein